MQYYRSFHAGPYNIVHDPIHGGLIIAAKNPKHTQMAPAALSAIVTGSDGKPYILSGTHVLRYWDWYSTTPDSAGNLILPSTPDVVQQPSPWAGPVPSWTETKLPARSIGTVMPSKTTPKAFFPKNTSEATQLAKISQIGSWLDASLARPTVNVSYDIPGIGLLTGHTEPKNDMPILIKTGWAQQVQEGKVVYGTAHASNDAGPNVPVPYNPLQNNIFSFTTAKPVLNGDSSSLVVEKGTNKAVGILTGVFTKGTFGYPTNGGGLARGCKASAIVSAYGVSFVGKPGVYNPSGKCVSGCQSSSPTPSPSPSPSPSPTLGIRDILLKEIDIAGHKAPVWMLGGGVLATMTILMVATANRR